MSKSLQNFLAFTAAFTLTVGAVLILFPDQIVPLFLSQMFDFNQYFFVRFLGSTLLGFSALNWYSQKLTKAALYPTLIGNFTTLTVATLISLNGVISGVLNAKGWVIVLMHLGFAVGFGYHLRKT